MTETDVAKFGKNNFCPMAKWESEKEKRRGRSSALKLKKQVIPVKLRQLEKKKKTTLVEVSEHPLW